MMPGRVPAKRSRAGSPWEGASSHTAAPRHGTPSWGVIARDENNMPMYRDSPSSAKRRRVRYRERHRLRQRVRQPGCVSWPSRRILREIQAFQRYVRIKGMLANYYPFVILYAECCELESLRACG